jgi:hypothetical protein
MRKAAIAGVAVIVCCAIYSLAQDKGAQFGGTQRWEYKIEKLDPDTSEKLLDELGKAGWELVAVTPEVMFGPNANRVRSDCHAYFKRPARILLNGPDAHK